MKRPANPSLKPRGVTLIEMSLVIGVLVALMTIGVFTNHGINEWKAGKEASETLRAVHIAQRLYLADHPTTSVSSLTTARLLPYLPQKPATFPTVKGLDGVVRTIKVTVSPPVVLNSGGSTYDPSGKSNDSLWDVGE